MTNAASEKGIAARKRIAANDREISRMVVESLMQHQNGRRWVWLELAAAHLFNDVDPTTLDALGLAYNAGVRHSGLRLLRDVTRFCPQLYAIMTTENTGVEVAPT